MSSTKKTIYIISAMSLIFMFAFFKLFVDNQFELCLFLGIVFMTMAYHLIVRLVIGVFCDRALENGIDPNDHWFADSDAEQSIYRTIGVRSWKNRIPMPDAWKFSIKKRSLEDVIAESCRTELVHEIGAVMSLLAVLLTIPFGYLWFFILTSALGGLFDLVFVIVQRYNRPRLMRTAAKKRELFFEKLEYDAMSDEFIDAENETQQDYEVNKEEEAQQDNVGDEVREVVEEDKSENAEDSE